MNRAHSVLLLAALLIAPAWAHAQPIKPAGAETTEPSRGPTPRSRAAPERTWAPAADGRPIRLPFDPDQPPPAGYQLVSKPRRGFLIGGGIPFGIFYGISLMEALSLAPNDETDVLALPVIGPFLAINRVQGCDPDDDDTWCETKRDLKYIWLAQDGAYQVIGATLITVGLTVRKHWYYRDDFAFTVTPTRVGRDAYGVGAIGRF